MVELICRDGETSLDELEELADTLFYSTGIDVVTVPERERRAMVFWGPEDV